jgi:dihydroxyacetone kinase
MQTADGKVCNCNHLYRFQYSQKYANSIIHTVNIQQFREVVSSAANSLLAAEDRITEYDTLVGDGDCGATLRRGAEAVLETLASDIPEDAGLAMVDLAQAIGRSMDGTSGAIFELFFNALASQLLEFRGTTGIVDLKVWATAAQGALKSLQNATPARVGDRTLMDALDPFITVLAKSQNLATAVTAARVGRDDTIGMTPSLGRAVYVDEAGWGKVPDPGAEGILAIVRGLLVDGCEDHVI